MEQIPSQQANRVSANQAIPCILWISEVCYSIHMGPQTVPVPSHNNPLHASPTHFLQMHFNFLAPELFF